ncbi:MAG: hypothetical protein SCK28_04295, partial [Bacillota bacterium]|nr:hypothetical protein [Bacillota bacterium]
QTYNPDNYAIKLAQVHDYPAFYERELQYRKMYDYPPYTKLLRILVEGSDNLVVEEHIKQIHKMIKEIIKNNNEVCTILGPLPAPINKLRNRFRWHILLKRIPDSMFSPLKEITDWYYAKEENIKVIIDNNPINIM